MSELLAPAGNMEALIAAVSNGANAIYLGMNRFGARAYANNFSFEELEEAIHYCHLRNVKIYVTMNTIVFDNELEDAYKQIDILYNLGVDGLIIQDLAIFSYVVENYPLLEAHTSTQMGIDDKEGTLLLKELGAKRVVLSREVPIEKIKEIKKECKIPLEIFVHGALCVSYSGGCYMSGLIGYRSGNRGRCVGSCRKPYELINTTQNESLGTSYILSMKDLKTLENINELKVADSLKVEGRMKEPVYVANIIKTYRDALDGKLLKGEEFNLTKTFNRTFTKGYIFHEDKKNIANIDKPNNYGYLIGYVSGKKNGYYEITLSMPVTQGDIIRIDHLGIDVNLSLTKIFDANENLISKADKKFYIQIKEKLFTSDKVYKTKDILFTEELEKSYPKEYKRFPLHITVYGNPNEPLTIIAECEGKTVSYTTDYKLDKALSRPTDYNSFLKQLSKLNDSIYSLASLEFNAYDIFLPVGKINDLRRIIVNLMDNERLSKRTPVLKKEIPFEKIDFKQEKNISVFCTTEEQYKACKDLGIDIIYYNNYIRRNEVTYKDMDGEVLVGGYGGIYHYRGKNKITSDFTMNVVNYKSVYILHKLGINRVCLSLEINKNQIDDLVNDYYKNIGGYPNLEMIVYGHSLMMFTHYCPLKVKGQCGKCRENKYILKDEFGEFPIINHKDCTTTILNGKTLNLMDELDSIPYINTYRIQLTIEDYDESVKIINTLKNKLNGDTTKTFNKELETRGHFNKEIL
ncbi:putative protease [Anaeroplasma bactoclasticum]|jgi:putative protease|uniref:Putative protease n=1 Tax=Anaeroplasma bactoclasticum TaxID=2088 RepID=A0A397RYT7_9MOLU|nr:U32 family peptidase [Anaeroplasma bactoclasticum]RIA75561.1 putative protease [Anaeroplasma bactoclasticum]